MSGLDELNPVGRFDGLAQGYALHRPDYPAAAVDLIISRAELGPASLLVDVGSGTGISSRLFAGRGVPVLGVEPTDEMRGRAKAVPPPPGCPVPSYQAGRAEATGLPDASADAVLAAQAFHWFDPAAALAEFRRVLRPGGWVALLWNERDESDPFSADFGAAMRTAPRAGQLESSRQRAGEALPRSSLFEAAQRHCFDHAQSLDRAGVLGRAFSASYAPREPDAVARFTTLLTAAFDRHQRGGRVTLRYRTSVDLARRPPQS